ncbi:hypothetical protein [Solitalea koreensis]|uniref:ATP synthase protein I n=1 Tax=Solitalea koreensis TaxID=543615 RepID=A0A521ATZ3_9SPHI|nr:hypothetical protein [Solitalea koreensis]SMO38201.1 hypothetical protein SAMN06265350_101400 [Solitalea koreensis]
MSFLKKYLPFIVLLAGLIFAFAQYQPELLHPYVWMFFAFFAVLNLSSYLLSSFGIKKGGESSVLLVLVSVVVKMLLTMTVALICIFMQLAGNKWLFISNFFILYFSFTAFEVYNLIYNLRDEKKIENR